MFNPKDISISIAPNLTYKGQGKHEHNHSAFFPCLSYTQFREVKIEISFKLSVRRPKYLDTFSQTIQSCHRTIDEILQSVV